MDIGLILAQTQQSGTSNAVSHGNQRQAVEPAIDQKIFEVGNDDGQATLVGRSSMPPGIVQDNGIAVVNKPLERHVIVVDISAKTRPNQNYGPGISSPVRDDLQPCAVFCDKEWVGFFRLIRKHVSKVPMSNRFDANRHPVQPRHTGNLRSMASPTGIQNAPVLTVYPL
jgi:hypothetical protein